jgi:hypothetical protein
MTTEEKIRRGVNNSVNTAFRRLEDLDYEMNLRFAILSVRTKIKLTKNHNETIKRRNTAI